MGLLIDGVWHDRWYDTGKTGGRFQREASRFHGRVTADGSSGLRAEAGRFRLILSPACPWSHRTTIFRRLKRLEQAIALTEVEPVMAERGWIMPDGRPLYELYREAEPRYTGRATVPVLWDEHRRSIVCNESAEIIRMLNREFDAFGDAALDFYPEPLRAEIDAIAGFVYDNLNNGVYRAGFATTQEAYEEAFDAVFAALDHLEDLLSRRRYAAGERITEADWRLFVTLVRFDAVYHGHFKCNKRRLVDYPRLWPYTRELFQVPGVAETVRLDQIKRHYYASHRTINPTGIVPKGPEIDFLAPHGRG